MDSRGRNSIQSRRVCSCTLLKATRRIRGGRRCQLNPGLIPFAQCSLRYSCLMQVYVALVSQHDNAASLFLRWHHHISSPQRPIHTTHTPFRETPSALHRRLLGDSQSEGQSHTAVISITCLSYIPRADQSLEKQQHDICP